MMKVKKLYKVYKADKAIQAFVSDGSIEPICAVILSNTHTELGHTRNLHILKKIIMDKDIDVKSTVRLLVSLPGAANTTAMGFYQKSIIKSVHDKKYKLMWQGLMPALIGNETIEVLSSESRKDLGATILHLLGCTIMHLPTANYAVPCMLWLANYFIEALIMAPVCVSHRALSDNYEAETHPSLKYLTVCKLLHQIELIANVVGDGNTAAAVLGDNALASCCPKKRFSSAHKNIMALSVLVNRLHDIELEFYRRIYRGPNLERVAKHTMLKHNYAACCDMIEQVRSKIDTLSHTIKAIPSVQELMNRPSSVFTEAIRIELLSTPAIVKSQPDLSSEERSDSFCGNKIIHFMVAIYAFICRILAAMVSIFHNELPKDNVSSEMKICSAEDISPLGATRSHTRDFEKMRSEAGPRHEVPSSMFDIESVLNISALSTCRAY